jgi:hypothetical protein
LFAPEKGALLYSVAGNHEADDHVHVTFDISLSEPQVFAGKPIVETVETLEKLTDFGRGIVASFELP